MTKQEQSFKTIVDRIAGEIKDIFWDPMNGTNESGIILKFDASSIMTKEEYEKWKNESN